MCLCLCRSLELDVVIVCSFLFLNYSISFHADVESEIFSLRFTRSHMIKIFWAPYSCIKTETQNLIRKKHFMKMINDWSRRYNWLKRTRKKTKLAIVKLSIAYYHYRDISFLLFPHRCRRRHHHRRCRYYRIYIYILYWIIYRFAVAMTWHSHMRHYETKSIFQLKTFQRLPLVWSHSFSLFLFLSFFLNLTQ